MFLCFCSVTSSAKERLFDSFAAVFYLILASLTGDPLRNGVLWISGPFNMFLESDSASGLFCLSVWGIFFFDFECMSYLVATLDVGTNRWLNVLKKLTQQALDVTIICYLFSRFCLGYVFLLFLHYFCFQLNSYFIIFYY